ncbi:alpha/beta hydrolase family protein [Phenylobacterium sp.]|uniref:alpha/beta hydrolase family protein n=1 Tax=Phenylobacterium sp. TaxID=1871053 RepID=UPI00374D9344
MKAYLAALAVSLALNSAALAAPPPPASAFGAPAAIRMIGISPDGQRLAIVSRDGDQAIVKIANIDKANVTLAKIGDVAVSRLRWLDDDRVIVDVDFPTKIFERYRTVGRVVVVNAVDGRAVTMLADNKTSNRLLRHWVSGVSPDKHLYMLGYPSVVNPARAAVPVLLKVDPATGTGEILEEGTGETLEWGIGKDGAVNGQTVQGKDGDFAIMVRPSPGAPLKEAWRSSGEESRAGYHGYSAPDDAIMITQRRPDGDQLVLRRLADGVTTPLGAPHPTAPMTYVWDIKARSLAGRGFGTERPRMEWLQPDLAAVHESLQKLFKSADVYLNDWSSDRTRFVVEVSSPDLPPTWYLYDKVRRELSALGDTHPELKGVQMGVTRWITFKARDGLEIGAYVTLPPGAASGVRRPLVILPHDELRSRDDFGFDPEVQFLATRGYVVLRPQYRGSSGFGDAFEKAADWEWGAKTETDLLDGVSELAAQGLVDPKRTCLVGENFAGYLALAGAALFPQAYACTVSISGASDLTGVLAGWGGAPFFPIRTVLQKSPRDPRIAAMSPRAHVADVKAPILLIWKAEDAAMPSEQSEAMANTLIAAHKSVQTVVLAGTDHWERTGHGAVQLYEALAAFLAKNLPVQ